MVVKEELATLLESGQDTVVQDQDTAISDAMCVSAQLFYDCASQISLCIAENAQCCIDNDLLHKAELALAFMQGVDFGLALDDKVQEMYLAEMEKSMASIKNSQRLAYQPMIYVPPEPSRIIGFDANRARKLTIDSLLPQALKSVNPNNRHILESHSVTKPIPKEPQKQVEDKSDTPALPPSAILQMREEKEKHAEDDSMPVLNLRNLFRQNKIDKNQFVGGLATLVATGLISKSDYTRLKATAN